LIQAITQILVVPTKQCRSIISGSYISQLLAARGVKSGIYKAIQGGISKPALLCMDYPDTYLKNAGFRKLGKNVSRKIAQSLGSPFPIVVSPAGRP